MKFVCAICHHEHPSLAYLVADAELHLGQRLCYEDSRGVYQQERSATRGAIYRAARNAGVTIEEIADAMGITTRTVYRLMARANG